MVVKLVNAGGGQGFNGPPGRRRYGARECLSVALQQRADSSANAWAAAQKATSNTKVVIATRSFTGTAAQADRWGELQVTIVVRKTTTINLTTKKKTVKRKIIKVGVPIYPNHTDRSVFINQQALPYLTQEVLQAQFNPNIQMISGASDTSDAFMQSLQSALLKAKSV